MTAAAANPSAQSAASASDAKTDAHGPMALFRHRAFAVLWIATVASNVGTWMHDVGAGWLMTELAPSPMMVAAVQSATTLPIFLFALLAGAVADIVDRRRLLIGVNLALGALALAMAAVVHLGLMTPWLLLVFTFAFGTGAAFMAPTWQAIVPKLIPREDLPSAIALNSMGVNISRAIGPALAGFLIVGAGLAAPFVINAVSVVGIIAALWWWRPAASLATSLPPEHVGGAMIAGLRYALNSPALKATLARAAAFFVFASAFWAMLPLIARETLSGGPTLYGILLAAVGSGAVGGAFLLARIKAALGPDGAVSAGTLGVVAAMLALATAPSQVVSIGASAVAGLSWITVLSSLNVSAQTALPDWVRARGLSVFLTVFFGSMSLGSLVWGQIATLSGVSTALIASAIGAAATALIVRRAKLQHGAGDDLAPSMHWPEPVLSRKVPADSPVMIQIAYRPADERVGEFLALMNDLASSRLRGGGYHWSLLRDAAEEGVFVESWREASWLAHQRQHLQVNHADEALQSRIRETLIDQAAPPVRHFVAPI
ncbi:MAG: MFS transporter [Pseudomonadota bacterium]